MIRNALIAAYILLVLTMAAVARAESLRVHDSSPVLVFMNNVLNQDVFLFGLSSSTPSSKMVLRDF